MSDLLARSLPGSESEESESEDEKAKAKAKASPRSLDSVASEETVNSWQRWSGKIT